MDGIRSIDIDGLVDKDRFRLTTNTVAYAVLQKLSISYTAKHEPCYQWHIKRKDEGTTSGYSRHSIELSGNGFILAIDVVHPPLLLEAIFGSGEHCCGKAQISLKDLCGGMPGLRYPPFDVNPIAWPKTYWPKTNGPGHSHNVCRLLYGCSCDAATIFELCEEYELVAYIDDSARIFNVRIATLDIAA